MNWSHSIVVFFDGGARAHPPGVAPEALVEYSDSSEVFYASYWGMVSYRGVIHIFLFEVRFCCGRAPEPRTHEVDQSLGSLLSFDPHSPFSRKKE
jgi:hypothetical protein